MGSRTTSMLIISLFIGFLSCNPDDLDRPTRPKTLPKANAGNDSTYFTVESNAIYLDASKSTDDARLDYSWKQLAGPSVILLNVVIQNVQIRDTGAYVFALEVTDLDGNRSSDTVTHRVRFGISCNPNSRLLETSYREEVVISDTIPSDPVVASDQNTVVFAGGRTLIDDGWGNGNIYTSNGWAVDLNSKAIRRFQLSKARAHIGAAVSGHLAVFAGGEADGSFTDTAEIINLVSGQRKIIRMSEARAAVAVAIVGDYILFAGGVKHGGLCSGVVDVYKMATDTWTLHTLTRPRAGMAVAVSGTEVYFTGGSESPYRLPVMGDIYPGFPNADIEVFNSQNMSWRSGKMNIQRQLHASTFINGDLMVLGGYNASMKPLNSGERIQPSSLSSGSLCLIAGQYEADGHDRILPAPVTRGRYLHYQAGSVINRYDVQTRTWDFVKVPDSIYFDCIVSTPDELYGLALKDVGRVLIRIDVKG